MDAEGGTNATQHISTDTTCMRAKGIGKHCCHCIGVDRRGYQETVQMRINGIANKL
jgi:hypothetical protein